MDKFLGLGLVNILGLWLLFTIFSAFAKTIALSHPIEGVSDIILAG